MAGPQVLNETDGVSSRKNPTSNKGERSWIDTTMAGWIPNINIHTQLGSSVGFKDWHHLLLSSSSQYYTSSQQRGSPTVVVWYTSICPSWLIHRAGRLVNDVAFTLLQVGKVNIYSLSKEEWWLGFSLSGKDNGVFDGLGWGIGKGATDECITCASSDGGLKNSFGSIVKPSGDGLFARVRSVCWSWENPHVFNLCSIGIQGKLIYLQRYVTHCFVGTFTSDHCS